MKTVMCYTAGQTTKGAVAIRKPAGAGNGYRVCWVGAFRKYESPVPPLCGDTGPEKKVEGVQRFSMSEAFLRFYWQLFRKQCKKRCRAMMPATFFRPKWYKCHR